MRFVLTAAVAFCLLVHTPTAIAQAIAPEALRADLEIVWSAAEQGDPAFDRYRSRAELRRVFDEARARINRPMTELEFYRIAAPAVAALGNGHARLSLRAETQTWLDESARLLPLGTRVLAGDLYVIRDLSREQSVPVGARILSINGRSADDIIRGSVEAMSLDGTSMAPRMNNAGGWTLIRDLARIQGFDGDYDIRYRHRGRVRTVHLEGRPGVDISAEWRRTHPTDTEIAAGAPAALTWDGDVAIIRIPHWDRPREGQPGLSEHYAEWFAELARRPTRALVIDIRNNSGGAEPLATELLSYLVEAPFRYYACLNMNAADFDFFRNVAEADEFRTEIPQYVRPASAECRERGALELTEAAFPNLGVQAPREPGFRGPVFLLINSGSFSTSSEFASAFKALNAGTLIGQETSGGYLGDSSGIEADVRLPASGMTFNATLIAYHMATPRRRGVQGGVLPDIPIRYRVADILAGRDLEMERALELARGN